MRLIIEINYHFLPLNLGHIQAQLIIIICILGDLCEISGHLGVCYIEKFVELQLYFSVLDQGALIYVLRRNTWVLWKALIFIVDFWPFWEELIRVSVEPVRKLICLSWAKILRFDVSWTEASDWLTYLPSSLIFMNNLLVIIWFILYSMITHRGFNWVIKRFLLFVRASNYNVSGLLSLREKAFKLIHLSFFLFLICCK